jgi:hypothetical protein
MKNIRAVETRAFRITSNSRLKYQSYLIIVHFESYFQLPVSVSTKFLRLLIIRLVRVESLRIVGSVPFKSFVYSPLCCRRMPIIDHCSLSWSLHSFCVYLSSACNLAFKLWTKCLSLGYCIRLMWWTLFLILIIWDRPQEST